MLLFSYDGNTQFRIYDPVKNKVLSNIRDIDFIENEFLEPSEFANVPYTERPLLVPEPRNYTEEDQEIDNTSLTGKIPKFWNLSLTSRYPCQHTGQYVKLLFMHLVQTLDAQSLLFLVPRRTP